jgi:hypothetical protein
MLTQTRDEKAQVFEVLPVPRVLRESRQIDRFAFHAKDLLLNGEESIHCAKLCTDHMRRLTVNLSPGCCDCR